MTVLAFVIAGMTMLAPGREHTATAAAIADVVDAEPALFKDDTSKLRTAALVLAISFRESSFKNDARSKTNDHCLMQIHGRPDLAADVRACVRVGLAMLRESMRMCPSHPVAFYASGPGACSNERAKRISNDRMWLARKLTNEVRL